MSHHLILALGGHALGMPEHGDYAAEREQIEQLRPVFARLSARGYRLLVVHGNGPQVGHLVTGAGGMSSLDIHVAQTQGELGYQLAAALPPPAVSIVTRVRVPQDAGPPVKPIGPFLTAAHPTLPCRQYPDGWRVLVPSPRPEVIVELAAIRTASATAHVVAGGGGGIPVDVSERPVMAVVDKDWVALELALALDAAALLFVTNVDHVYTRFGHPDAAPLRTLDAASCERLLQGDELGAGSMHPKLAAASAFVRATGKHAAIGLPRDIDAMLESRAGTRVVTHIP